MKKKLIIALIFTAIIVSSIYVTRYIYFRKLKSHKYGSQKVADFWKEWELKTRRRKEELKKLGDNYITDSIGDAHPSKELLKTKETVDKFLRTIEGDNLKAAWEYWRKPYDYEKYSKQQVKEFKENLKLIMTVLKNLKRFSYVDSSFFDATQCYEPYYLGPPVPKPEIPPATLNLVAEGNWPGINRSKGGVYYLENFRANFDDFNGLEVTFNLMEGQKDNNQAYIREINITGPQPLILKLLAGQDYETFYEGFYYFPLSDSQKLQNTIIKEKWTIKECDQLTTSKNFCINKVALLWEDPSLCNQLSSISASDDSKDRCIETVAKEAKDVSMCEQIKKEYLRDSCVYYMAVKLQDEKLCEKCSPISDQSSSPPQKVYCYSAVAKEKGDVDLCDKAGHIKYLCIEGVAEKLQEEKICERSPEDKRPNCYRIVAMAKKDAGLCDKDVKSRDLCIQNIAVNSLNEDLCAICSEKQRTPCYSLVAEAKKSYEQREKHLNRFNSN